MISATFSKTHHIESIGVKHNLQLQSYTYTIHYIWKGTIISSYHRFGSLLKVSRCDTGVTGLDSGGTFPDVEAKIATNIHPKIGTRNNTLQTGTARCIVYTSAM